MAQTKQVYILLSMGVILAINFIANIQIFDSKKQSSFRSPASTLVSTHMRSFESIDQQSSVAEKLAHSTNRILASIGKQPNPLDQFRFGVLEGKYAVTLSGEKIKDIEFINTPNSEGSPTQVADRAEFLKSNARLLNIKTEIEKLQTDIVGRRIVEVFKARNIETDQEVKIKVEIDELDRLYKVSTLAISQVF